MSPRYYVETTTSGRPQFVLKRSRSHGHHHHHHRHHHHDHHHDHAYKVTYEEWKNLLEREHTLEESNRDLVAENNALRASLSTTEADAHRLSHVIVPQLQAQVAALEADNKSLRRSLENVGGRSTKHHREVERLNSIIAKLDAENKEFKEENADLKIRVKALSKQLDQSFNRRIADLTKELEYWKDNARGVRSRYEDIRQRYEDTLDALERQMKRIEMYEDILRRRRNIHEHLSTAR